MTASFIVPRSDTCAVEISMSKDRGRVSIGVLTRPNANASWRPSGPAPSFPSVLLDTTIDALQALRAKMERER